MNGCKEKKQLPKLRNKGDCVKTSKVEINLSEDALYRVKDGQLEKLDKPAGGFGEVTQRWQDNKLGRYEVKYTK